MKSWTWFWLISTTLEQHFPLAIVVALKREISDHTLLLLSTGIPQSGTISRSSSLSWASCCVMFFLLGFGCMEQRN
jgi:hypothetical protein